MAGIERPNAWAGAGPQRDVPVGHSLNSPDRKSDQLSGTPARLGWRARRKASKRTIPVVAELYPQCFTAEKWQPHRPLKIGVHLDLIARGVLLPDECRALFLRYCFRLMYQRALAAGGPRFDLDGNVVGEVAADEIEHARAVVAQMEAKVLAQAEAARIEKAERKRVAKQAMPAKPKAPPSDSGAPRRFGLADLKAAAAARRNGGTP
jgi:sRNA-binding protein